MTGGGARRDFWCWPGLVSRFVSWSQGGLHCDHAVYLMSVPFLVLMLHCNKSNSHNHKQHPPGPAPVHGMVDQICSLTSEGTDCKRTLPGYEGGALHFISEVSPAGPRGILGGENREGLPTTSLPHAQLEGRCGPRCQRIRSTVASAQPSRAWSVAPGLGRGHILREMLRAI